MKAKFIADWRQATKLEFNAFRCSAACDHAFKEMTIHPTFKVVVMVPVQSESPTKSVKVVIDTRHSSSSNCAKESESKCGLLRYSY